MLHRMRLILFLLMVAPVLMGVGPFQEAAEGFKLQWWHILCVITLVVVALLWFISMLAGRSAPATDKEPEKYGTTLSHTSAPPPAPKPEPKKAAAAPPAVPAASAPPPVAKPVAPPAPPAPQPEPEPEPTPEPISFAAASPAPEPVVEQEDDLAGKLEGIGPGIQGVLYGSGIKTFSQLAATPVTRLEEILTAAGDRYRLADPTSWPEQAQLAAAGDWQGLEELQDSLKGGRAVTES